MQLKDNIRKIRLVVDKTQEQFGVDMGVNETKQKSYELGRAVPDILYLARITKFSGFDLEELNTLELNEEEIKHRVQKVHNASRGTHGKGTVELHLISDNDKYIQSLNERIAEHKERINEIKEILGGVNSWLQDLVKSNLGTLLANQGVTQETIRVLLERDVHKESGGNQEKEREILNQIRAEILQNTGLNVKLGTHDGANIANK